MVKRIFSLSIYLFLSHWFIPVLAQNRTDLDKPVADYHQLSVGDYIPASVYNTFSKGETVKLTILDFWSTYCGTCIDAFPKMKELQRKFSGEGLQVVLVNSWEDDAEVHKRMAEINERRVKNNLPPHVIPDVQIINGDTLLRQLFPAIFVPHHVWIDGNRKVLAITHGYNATPERVRKVLAGEKPVLKLKDDIAGKRLMDSGYLRPILSNMPPVYYSAFIPYYSAGASGLGKIDSIHGTFRIDIYNNDVLRHFRMAFRNSDEMRERIIYSLHNKEAYIRPKDRNLWDEWSRKYRFTYELQGRLEDRDKWQQKMQQDANYFFGNLFGIQGAMEKRKFNSLVMVKTKDGLLKTSGGKRSSETINNKTVITNMPFRYIQTILQLDDFEKSQRPFIDETGFTGNVDMIITGDLSNLENVRKQLKAYGLDIIEAERELDVLAISDIKQQ